MYLSKSTVEVYNTLWFPAFYPPISKDEELDDALAWWTMQEKLLPVMRIIAWRLLCPSERVLSVVGLTISKNRTAVALLFFLIVGNWPRNVNRSTRRKSELFLICNRSLIKNIPRFHNTVHCLSLLFFHNSIINTLLNFYT